MNIPINARSTASYKSNTATAPYQFGDALLPVQMDPETKSILLKRLTCNNIRDTNFDVTGTFIILGKGLSTNTIYDLIVMIATKEYLFFRTSRFQKGPRNIRFYGTNRFQKGGPLSIGHWRRTSLAENDLLKKLHKTSNHYSYFGQYFGQYPVGVFLGVEFRIWTEIRVMV